ncbi:O-acetylhomoserine sulfhydrylase [Candidatus Rhodobacter oscarellae]|uniref:O-acetylhomoserine sulfhydrylase n=1 Tax=Candidatus Rhodobacter oscarellae TaxID=1675527 RepID=A0A0J9E614_9RHOB|nr:aminotransferase class I/II-fold pyridoxal phosphate-dependent enzyme [Candidatus Rhodobacter lobularis]KMW57259.1 O-acetylhomoserine sulfhydrylase [Candidatus Rhodobacter lobularis]
MTKTPPKTIVRRTPWPESSTRAIGTPLQPSVVYAAESPDALDDMYEGRAPGYAYAREGHPNADVLARKIDALEGATGGLVFGSGMAAVTAVMQGLLRSGDHVLAGNQLYGRSMRMLSEELPKWGVEADLADPTDAARFAQAIKPNTKLILLEVVSNPTLRVSDVTGIAALARKHGCILVIDNTFTTPRGFQPFQHGADIVIHSVTKLLAGHSDATLGYVACSDAAHRDPIYATAVTLGLTASPFDCWLAERGLYSFELRYDRAEANARALADALAETPGVARVLYPTRPDHPDHNRAASLLGARGGNMVSFEIGGGRAAANALVRAAPDIAFAPTLGDIGTTLSHPATSSHRALTPQARAELGMSEGFFRVSVGVEDVDMLIGEFRAAIAAATGA